MNYTEQDSRNNIDSPPLGETSTGNYYAFFDKPVPENLAANRSGILSPQQQIALKRNIAYRRSTTAIIVAMYVCVVLAVFIFLWLVNREDGTYSMPDLAISGVVITILIVMLASLLAGEWIVFFTGDELENGAVESAAGRVVWNGRRYEMRSDVRRLRWLRSGFALPPPGEYRFYYLPRTGLVVMADELRKPDAGESASILLQTLASANKFSMKDLETNYQGSLSAGQEYRLLLVFALYLLIFLSSAVLFASVSSQILRSLGTTMFYLLLVIGILLMTRFGWSAALMIADIWNGKVDCVAGQVVRQSKRSRYHRSFYYVIDPHKFEVSQSAYNALLEGNSYRIYYVPRSKRLVSIEPM